ncbi:MAG: carbohydrate-binding family 9-like protein [Myxococcales bacterium]
MAGVRFAWLLCFGLLGGCVSTPPTESHDSEKASEELKSFILSDVPADIGAHVDADFGGKVILLGARVEPAGTAKPGDKIKVTMYWKSEQKLDGAWKLFTHIVDAAGERILNIDNVGPLRELRSGSQALPPGDWTPGKVYVDEQSFTVPEKVKADKIQIVTGIYGKSGRLEITAGPHDTSKRAIVATLALTGVHPHFSTHIPTLRVEKLEPNVTIKLDGKLDEPAWKDAASTGPLVDVRSGEPNKDIPVNGDVKVLWNDTGMYVGFSVADTDIIGGFKKGDVDPHLWTKDTVEIMVDPDGDGDNKDYYEIQVGPQNLVFDSQFDGYNEPKVEPNGPFGHQDWSSNLKSGVTVDGTVDKSTDEDRGYTVEVMIPWKSFSKAAKVPPELGSSWRVNFYAMKNNGGVSWSPILGQGNFHKASRFGRIVWTKKGEPSAPGPAGSAERPHPGAILKAPSRVAAPAPAAPVAPAPSH